MIGAPPSDWFSDFFTFLPNEFWRRVVPVAATDEDVRFIESTVGLSSSAAVLDVPCGSGRHSLALARRGHRVTGVDLSAEAIAHASDVARAESLAVRFERRDMRELGDLDGMDAAICMGNSFCYLDTDAAAAFVTAVRNTLRPGGAFVIDNGFAAESLLPAFSSDERVMSAGDITVHSHNRYDVAASRVISRYRFTSDDDEVEATAIHHVMTAGQIARLLIDGGFDHVSMWNGAGGSRYALGDPRLIVTARRAD